MPKTIRLRHPDPAMTSTWVTVRPGLLRRLGLAAPDVATPGEAAAAIRRARTGWLRARAQGGKHRG